jgi:adenylosuccinate synthase
MLGTQFSDEGRGELVDILTEKADICVQNQDGNNAGHTIVASGIMYDCNFLPGSQCRHSCASHSAKVLNANLAFMQDS